LEDLTKEKAEADTMRANLKAEEAVALQSFESAEVIKVSSRFMSNLK
jgi:hypothetical protein